MALPKDQFVLVDGIQTRYWCDGEGAPMLLLHGLSESVENWGLVFENLAEKYHVYALDWPGHGRTGHLQDGSYSLIRLASFVRHFMDAMKMDQAHIVGHSLGGAITLELVRQFPICADKIVLIDSAGYGREIGAPLRLVTLPFVGEILLSVLLPNDRQKYVSSMLASFRNSSEVTEEVLLAKFAISQMHGYHDAILKTLRANVNLNGQNAETVQTLLKAQAQFPNSTLIIWGENDDTIPLAHGHLARKALKNSRLEVIPNCGHEPSLEHPRQVIQLIKEFIQ